MKHAGDITKIKGNEMPTVDCIIFGAPCQDLSVAGKRKGMLHESKGDTETSRSGLFYEAIRIVREMRENDRRNRRTDEPIRPRYAVYENVPGAFSSNSGEDWRCVLEEVARISEATVTIPGPEKGKWSNSGVIIGDSWSIAWRVFDAQYWGVPQRRRRICLVADFNGHSAAEIIFNESKQFRGAINIDSDTSVRDFGDESGCEIQPESESLSGDSEQSRETWEDVTEDAERSLGASDIAYTYQDREGKPGGGKGGLIQEDMATSLRTNNYMTVFQPVVLESNQNHATATQTGICPTLPASMGLGGGYVPMVTQPKDVILYQREFGGKVTENPIASPTLEAAMGMGGNNQPIVCYDARGNGDGDTASNLLHRDESSIGDYSNVVVQAFRKQGHPMSADEGQGWEEADKSDTLNVFDNSESRTPTVVVSMGHDERTSKFTEDGVSDPLVAADYKQPTIVAYPEIQDVKGIDVYNQTETGDVPKPLTASATDSDHIPCVIEHKVRYIVRRLTPLECERLQGFPDNWTDIGDWTDSTGKTKKLADSNRYKALGNSIALPSWRWVLKRMSAQYERPCTMASLFDGISGFPLIWEGINGKGTCLWASEIEEFPIAVTTKRFGGNDNE